MEAALDAYTQDHVAITGALVMPVLGAGELVGELVDADVAEVARFMDVELAGSIACRSRSAPSWTTCRR